MTLKEKYLPAWQQRGYQFQYYPDHFNEDTWDYEAVEGICGKIKALNVGDSFKFSENNFIVRDKNERYVIATTKSGKTYTIIDTETGVCGPSDRTFQLHDFNDAADVKTLLEMLTTSEWQLSYRNSVPVNMYISF